jgi:putative spermidine/putrescine transport system permease protein
MSPPPAAPFGGRAQFQRARRKAALQALLLALPLLVFLLATFVAPIAQLLARSVENPEVSSAMPQLAHALQGWNGTGLPDEQAFAALAGGLKQAADSGQLGNVRGAFANAACMETRAARSRSALGRRKYVAAAQARGHVAHARLSA